MRSIARPCGSSCGRASRAGATSSAASCRSTRSAARTSRRSGATGSTTRRRATAIGSGPFLVERWERGKQLTLRRNPRYWGAAPRLRRPARPPLRGVAGGAIVDGFADAASSMSPPDFHQLLPGRSSSAGRCARSPRVARLGLGALRRSASDRAATRRFASKLVRRALAYGIDRAALVRAIFGRHRSARLGSATASSSPDARAGTTGRTGVHTATGRREARRLLEQAGCRRGADGIYIVRGAAALASIRAPVFPVAIGPASCELVQAQLRAVGVEVVPVFASPGAFFDQILPRARSTSRSSRGAADRTRRGRRSSAAAVPRTTPGTASGSSRADLDQADRILDADQQARVLNRADVQLARDVPAIPLFEQPPVGAL